MLQEAHRRPANHPTNVPAKPDPALADDWHVVAFSKDLEGRRIAPAPAAGRGPGGMAAPGQGAAVEGPLHSSRRPALEGLGDRRHRRLPLPRLALRLRRQVRADPGASGHRAAAEGQGVSAPGGRALRLHLGLARQSSRTTSRRFPNGGGRDSASSMPGRIRSPPTRSDRSRTSSTRPTFRSCIPVSTA